MFYIFLIFHKLNNYNLIKNIREILFLFYLKKVLYILIIFLDEIIYIININNILFCCNKLIKSSNKFFLNHLFNCSLI